MEVHELRTTPHPPSSPDLEPSDFFFFGHLRRTLQGSEFDSVEQLLDTVVKILSAISPERLLATFHEWMDRPQACIDGEGEYVDS
jgi:hypothetical protein